MEGPGHVSLPTLGDDPAVPLDDLTHEADLTALTVHHLHLVRLEAQYEVTPLGGGEWIAAEFQLNKQWDKFSYQLHPDLYLLHLGRSSLS